MDGTKPFLQSDETGPSVISKHWIVCGFSPLRVDVRDPGSVNSALVHPEVILPPDGLLQL